MVKIAVVGPEESKWTNAQRVDAKEEVKALFWEGERRISQTESKWKPERILKAKIKIASMIQDAVEKEFPNRKRIYQKELEQIILVSGHCPKGGVDIWAEEIADELGIKKEIYPAEVNQWDDKMLIQRERELGSIIGKQIDGEMGSRILSECLMSKKVLKGYRSRNIQIAEACDVLYCIVPKTYPRNVPEEKRNKSLFCAHCGGFSEHPTNGGCWTMKYAKKLGKETHLVVIE